MNGANPFIFLLYSVTFLRSLALLEKMVSKSSGAFRTHGLKLQQTVYVSHMPFQPTQVVASARPWLKTWRGSLTLLKYPDILWSLLATVSCQKSEYAVLMWIQPDLKFLSSLLSPQLGNCCMGSTWGWRRAAEGEREA